MTKQKVEAANKHLNEEFMVFAKNVFPNCGEQQLSDLSIVWNAGIFTATNAIAAGHDLTAVHAAAYDQLEQHNQFAEAQINGAKQ